MSVERSAAGGGIAAGRFFCVRAGRGRRGSESVHVPRRQPRMPAPPLLPGFASVRSHGLGWQLDCVTACAPPRQSRRSQSAEACFARGDATSVHQAAWVGHRLRPPMQCRGAQSSWPRARSVDSCSDSLRLSERSERSSRSRGSATGPARFEQPQGTVACRRRRCIRSRRRCASPAAHACPQQSSKRQAAMRRQLPTTAGS